MGIVIIVFDWTERTQVTVNGRVIADSPLANELMATNRFSMTQAKAYGIMHFFLFKQTKNRSTITKYH